jgi:hypothetical protein
MAQRRRLRIVIGNHPAASYSPTNTSPVSRQQQRPSQPQPSSSAPLSAPSSIEEMARVIIQLRPAMKPVLIGILQNLIRRASAADTAAADAESAPPARAKLPGIIVPFEPQIARPDLVGYLTGDLEFVSTHVMGDRSAAMAQLEDRLGRKAMHIMPSDLMEKVMRNLFYARRDGTARLFHYQAPDERLVRCALTVPMKDRVLISVQRLA